MIPNFFVAQPWPRWIDAGHEVNYLLLTRGDKGSDDPSINPAELMSIRMIEQQEAANMLGVKEVTFLTYQDGYVVPDLEMRKEIVRTYPEDKPDIIVTSDP